MRRALFATLLFLPLPLAVACSDDAASTPAPAPAPTDSTSSSTSSSSSSSSSTGGTFNEAGITCRELPLPATKAPRVTDLLKPNLGHANYITTSHWQSYALRHYLPDGGPVTSEPDVWRGTVDVDGLGGITFTTEDPGGGVWSQTYRVGRNADKETTLSLLCESGVGPKTPPLEVWSNWYYDPSGATPSETELIVTFPGDEPFVRVYREVK